MFIEGKQQWPHLHSARQSFALLFFILSRLMFEWGERWTSLRILAGPMAFTFQIY
jgi:hypothetical protein